MEGGAGLACCRTPRRRPRGAGSQGLPCGDSSGVAAARWPSKGASEHLSAHSSEGATGFSEVTLPWRTEAGLQLCILHGKPTRGSHCDESGAPLSHLRSVSNFSSQDQLLGKKGPVVWFPRVQNLDITLARRVLSLLLMAKGLLPPSRPVRCGLSYSRTVHRVSFEAPCPVL